MRKDFQKAESFAEQKYDLINIGSGLTTNVLTLTLAILALGMGTTLVGTYTWLRGHLQASLEAEHKAMLAVAEAEVFYKVYTNLSHAFYLYYRTFFRRPDHPGFKNGVVLAIWFSDGAISNAEKLPKQYKGKRHMLRYAESHRAYHYASQGLLSSPNTGVALRIASQLKDFADELENSGKPGLEGWMYRDTVAWVLIRLGNNQQKGEGRRIVSALLEHADVPPSFREHIRENDCGIGEIFRSS